jgi:Phage derived protein Gp49-like (DUF891)
MPLWTFKCPVNREGKSPLEEWYRNLSPRAKSRFDRVREYLEDRPQSDWTTSYFKQLSSSDGICEIRFFADNIQYRPLAFFSPWERQVLILVFPAIEKGDKFEPKDAVGQAENRKKKIISGKLTIKECCFDEEDI